MNKLKAVLAVFALFGAASAANAVIVLTPTSPGVIAGFGYGPSNCEPTCVNTVFGTSGLSLLYKDNAGGGEEGLYASSYGSLFYNTLSDPSNAIIAYTGGPAISCGGCYLAIKDGNSSPGYYFFNLSAWNGIETISLMNFWPQRGAISHISIWGSPGASVPEPATLGLFGLGLLSIGFARRKKQTV